MSFLMKNLAALQTNVEEEQKKIEELVQKAAERYELLPSRTKEYGLIYRGEYGESTIHSKYDPLREATRIVDNLAEADAKADIIVVFGFGLGYHVELLVQRLTKHQQIFIVEPVDGPGILALEKRDLTSLLGHTQVHMLITDSAKEAGDVFENIVDIKRDSKIFFFFFSPQEKLYRELFKDIRQSLVDTVNKSKMLENTLKVIGSDTVESLVFNIGSYISNPGIKETFDKFKNVPAFIVAAGPSLNKNVELLKKAKGKGIIIAVGTAVATLQLHGIEPDIVIALDPGIPNYKIFEKLTFTNTMLMFDLQTNYKILDKFTGSKFMFAHPNNLIKEWLNPFYQDNDSYLFSGGSVANSACCLAHRMGCNPIVFVGQDLCLSEDGHTHAAGTVYEKDTHSNDDAILVDGNNGGKVRTLANWYCFLKWFEDFIACNESREYINATEGGALIKGTKVLPLSQVIKDHCNIEVQVQKELLTIIEGYHVDDSIKQKTLTVLDDKIKEYENIHKKLEKARVCLANINREAGKMNRHLQDKLLKQIASINKSLNESKEFLIIEQLDYTTVTDTLRKTYVGARNGEDTFNSAAQDTLGYYEGMIEATNKFRSILETAKRKLKGEGEYGTK